MCAENYSISYLVNYYYVAAIFLPGFYMKYITDSSVEDIERYLDSSYAMNYLDIGSGIELILILLAIVSTLSLIVRFIRNTTKK